ncbi:MAG: hypothetical protein JRI68_06810 [Deltaproteobacteria bacterium]|nr:hypothetical protein [Deltaproteobacteria bacterium]
MSDAADEAIAEALWRKVTDDLESDEAHQKLVEHFRGRGELAEAARLYREHKEELDPDDDAETIEGIDQRLSGIAILAIAQLDVTKTEAKPHGLAVTFFMVVLGLMCVAAVAGLLKALLS